MRTRLVVVLGVLVLLSSACATNFIGPAYVQGGAQGCAAKCQAQGMNLVGMVFLGEYTDGCVCALPGYEQAALDAAGTVAGSAVGVILQMRRNEQQGSAGAI